MGGQQIGVGKSAAGSGVKGFGADGKGQVGVNELVQSLVQRGYQHGAVRNTVVAVQGVAADLQGADHAVDAGAGGAGLQQCINLVPAAGQVVDHHLEQKHTPPQRSGGKSGK